MRVVLGIGFGAQVGPWDGDVPMCEVGVIEIDGSARSGSGTLLRHAVALATLVRRPLWMTGIRARREKPGLRPQHLQAVRACCSLSGGRVEGAEVGSQEIRYWPGSELLSGDYRWDIGTAGSTTMLAFTLIPLALFASGPSQFSLHGGLFQDLAPSAFHMQKLLVPLIARMGGRVEVEVRRPGYLPKGQGHLLVRVKPLRAPLKPLYLDRQGSIEEISGIALASHLEKERVSERMAERGRALLAEQGYRVRMDVLRDRTAVQKGAALLLWTETSTGCLLGADQAGRPGRRSEAIAEFVAASLLEDLRAGATVDRHLADQLVLFAALADGTTAYRLPRMTEHVESNLWLVARFLGVRDELEGNLLRIHGAGLHRARNGPV